MYIFSEPDVANLFRTLTKSQCQGFMAELENALIAVSAEFKSTVPAEDKLIHQPLRTVFATNAENTCMFMPVSNTETTGIKCVTVAPGGIQGVINLFSPDGRLEALLAAAEITAFRTALASMILLVRSHEIKKENILIFGSGRQAEWHARLALLLYPEQVQRLVFVNRSRARLNDLERHVLSDLRARNPVVNISVIAKEDTPHYSEVLLRELQNSNVIFSCTPSLQPNFSFSSLQSVPKQRFISLIGSYKPPMHEIDTPTLFSGDGKIYVDSKVACLEESGELITAGVQEDQLTEMGDLLASISPGEGIQIPIGANVIYKCVGMGLMDLVVGKKILEVGTKLGLGTRIDGF